MRAGIYNSRRDHGADEGGGLANNGEKGEEEKFLATRRDFADHNLGVAVPGADEETVESLVYPELPAMMEAEGLCPDTYHSPTVAAAVVSELPNMVGLEYGGAYSKIIPTITALNMVLVLSWNLCWVHQKL